MFTHNESTTKSWLISRHPGVVLLDSVGILSSVYWLMQSRHWTTDIYLLTVLLLYGVSALYHHAVYRTWLGKLDHTMIFYVIAITALPYWGYYMPWDWYWGGIITIIAICLVGTVVKTVSFLPRVVSGVTYLAAAVPMMTYFMLNIELVPFPYGAIWIFGLVMYASMLLVYTKQTPDPLPAYWGFREVQHTKLLIATNLHSFVAVSLT